MTHSEYVIKIAEIETRQKNRRREKEIHIKNQNILYEAEQRRLKAVHEKSNQRYIGKYRTEQDADEDLKLRLKIEYIKSKEEAAMGGDPAI